MAGNITPIFSRVAQIQGGNILTTAAADYTGQGINNKVIFTADATNGGYVQRLRFKALGTNGATVARIFINDGDLYQATTLSSVSGTPTGTPSGSGGNLPTGNYFAKIQAFDAWNGMTALSTETASVSVTGPTGSIAWSWTAVTGATSYRVWVGNVTNGEFHYFTTSTNSYSQTTFLGTLEDPTDKLSNNMFFGEVSLPGTTSATTTATTDVDYPMNIALPPAYRIVVGLGAVVAAGWQVIAVGGKY
jgi:hypothetical protein